MKLLDVLFWGILLWALVDSFLRWLGRRRVANLVIHAYVPIHHVGAALGVALWALDVGNLDYDTARVEWLRLIAVTITLVGWLLTFTGRKALGVQWTPDVIRVAPDSRVRLGPYALLKHPIYIGEAVFFLGISLYLANVPTFVFLFLGGTIYNAYRASVES